ncbi:unnamed protein product [Nippostrongylus brasiliensis]|uniref:Uncharacterized F-box protein (inferred by orthology to a C. elegans protein) n=1 Tax=Nippostrongylus brasiliensis TaxID=27835 RepID=A0A0N4YCK7_NIPBR|nr:unnamed protein product [Nippostrongylus brasiliensis]
MPLDEKLEVARDDPSTSGLDWQPKYQPPGIPRLSLVVNSLLFELKKANIKWKRNLKLLMRRKLTNAIDAERHRVERILLNGECTFMLELGVQLSSIALRLDADPSLRSLSSRKSSIRSKKLLDLDDSTLLYVARLLDGRSLLHFSQASQKIRRVIAPNISSLKRMQSAVYDVFVDFNKRTGREDVRALRRGRTVHFGNNVSASNWLPAIHRMYEDNRIRPIAFLFKGGHCAETHGRRYCEGADLRCFVEKDFIAFISLFVPHLQEVQLLTSSFGAIVHDRTAVKSTLDGRWGATRMLLAVLAVVNAVPPPSSTNLPEVSSTPDLSTASEASAEFAKLQGDDADLVAKYKGIVAKDMRGRRRSAFSNFGGGYGSFGRGGGGPFNGFNGGYGMGGGGYGGGGDDFGGGYGGGPYGGGGGGYGGYGGGGGGGDYGGFGGGGNGGWGGGYGGNGGGDFGGPYGGGGGPMGGFGGGYGGYGGGGGGYGGGMGGMGGGDYAGGYGGSPYGGGGYGGDSMGGGGCPGGGCRG